MDPTQKQQTWASFVPEVHQTLEERCLVWKVFEPKFVSVKCEHPLHSQEGWCSNSLEAVNPAQHSALQCAWIISSSESNFGCLVQYILLVKYSSTEQCTLFCAGVQRLLSERLTQGQVDIICWPHFYRLVSFMGNEPPEADVHHVKPSQEEARHVWRKKGFCSPLSRKHVGNSCKSTKASAPFLTASSCVWFQRTAGDTALRSTIWVWSSDVGQNGCQSHRNLYKHGADVFVQSNQLFCFIVGDHLQKVACGADKLSNEAVRVLFLPIFRVCDQSRPAANPNSATQNPHKSPFMQCRLGLVLSLISPVIPFICLQNL